MENWPVRKKKKRYRGLILALLMLVPAGYIGVQMVQVLRTNYQTQTAVAYSMSDVVRCDGMLAMDETVIPYEGAGVLGYQVNNGERVSAGTQVARLFADEASAQNRTLSEKLTEELSVLEKSQAGAAADVEALMNQNQQGIYSAAITQDYRMRGLPSSLRRIRCSSRWGSYRISAPALRT